MASSSRHGTPQWTRRRPPAPGDTGAGPLIGSVVITPRDPRPAESVRVEVRSPTGEVLGGPGSRVTINGVPGAVRYLQFERAGRRSLRVLAVADGLAERRTESVDVAGESVRHLIARAQELPAMLRYEQAPGRPHEVTLGLGTLPTRRRRGRTAKPAPPPDRTPAKDQRRPAAPATTRGAAPAPEPETAYEWDFGDGTTSVTASPVVTHDYFDAIDHRRGYGTFHVRCRARGTGHESVRTLTVHSAYTACRNLGTVVPHVKADTFAVKRFTLLAGTFTVRNIEDVPIVLDRLAVAPLSDDPRDPQLPGRPTRLEKPVEIAPRSTTVITVHVPIAGSKRVPGRLRHDVAGFTAIYAGRAGTLPVRVSATFEVRAGARDHRPVTPPFARDDDGAWPWAMVERRLDERPAPGRAAVLPRSAVVIDAATGTVAVSLARVDEGARPEQVRADLARILGTVLDPRRDDGRSDDELSDDELSDDGRRLALPLDAPPAPGEVEAGEVCDPTNLSDAERALAEQGHLACQRTDETIEVLMPARFMNARKGDVILSPGGPGLIGGLLRGVDPPQLYSHSGIMTRNYDEVTHSTASEERLVAHTRGVADGSQGFEPGALKYMWPGVVAQQVEDAVDGELFTDPDSPDGAQYLIYSFEAAVTGLTVDDEMVIIPPLVVKPDPMKETEAVREALHTVADEARAGAGRPNVSSKSHYRLYGYTDPTVGETQRAPADAGWAAGTFGSVCSSYIWLMHRRHGTHFEATTAHPLSTDLEPGDVSGGAAVAPGRLDGLYAYTAEERLAAGEWLFATLHDQVRDEAGWLGNLLTDAADDVANQMINAFATDDADAKNSRKWRDVGPASAVSPDNILWWDGPERGGLYGYAEPLMYREPRRESYTVSRWKRVLVSGRLAGRVTDDEGRAVPGALVQVYDGRSDLADTDGRYAIDDVPFGRYQIQASRVIDGSLYSATVDVDLQTAARTVDVRLAPPAEAYRRARIELDAWGIDGDGLLGKADVTDPGAEHWELELGPDRPINTLHREYRWGGECRMEYDVECSLLVGNVLHVEVTGCLYEGTKETTGKRVGSRGVAFTVAPDESGSAKLTVPSDEWAKKDEGRLELTVVNARNTN